jgi:holo-[acyl-carrier protein] synthase
MAGTSLFHGVDIVDLDRIEQAVTRWGSRFLQRVFTAGELRDAGGRVPSLAARFAAKEAAAKALGGGLRGFGAERTSGSSAVSWQELEVVRASSGQPSLRLHGRAAVRAQELGWEQITLSLSHARHIAIASVVVLARCQDETNP